MKKILVVIAVVVAMAAACKKSEPKSQLNLPGIWKVENVDMQVPEMDTLLQKFVKQTMESSLYFFDEDSAYHIETDNVKGYFGKWDYNNDTKLIKLEVKGNDGWIDSLQVLSYTDTTMLVRSNRENNQYIEFSLNKYKEK